ncbi:MAG TPA: hypothetical protein VHV31_01370 [Nitrolancea sp.]|jgi:hypothetical protein|nr:hypothetical protein [Nitrolancea sp.]
MFNHLALYLGPDSGGEGGGAVDFDEPTTQGSGSIDLDAVRDLILLVHPDAVPELVSGSNVAELIGSVDTARAAYQRVAETLRPAAPTTTGETTPPRVPAGGGQRHISVNVDHLSPAAKISEGLRRRHGRGA